MRKYEKLSQNLTSSQKNNTETCHSRWQINRERNALQIKKGQFE
jgi:hypothetical protein